MEQKDKKIFILGSSGWIGSHIVEILEKLYPETILFGSHCRNRTNFKGEHILFDYNSPGKMLGLINEIQPNIIINLLGGIDDALFQFHRSMIDQLKSANIFYAYVSSSMAFDSGLDKPHFESDTPMGMSAYGRFKERCEKDIKNALTHYAIFRFSAVHGFDRNKMSRTERFLYKLKAGEMIKVDLGVIQNRLEISRLTEMIAKISFLESAGIFHLGTTDQSEEYKFFKRIAVAFDFSPNQIEPVYTSQKKILTTVPKNMFEVLGDHYRFQEGDTVAKIEATMEFQKYKK